MRSFCVSVVTAMLLATSQAMEVPLGDSFICVRSSDPPAPMDLLPRTANAQPVGIVFEGSRYEIAIQRYSLVIKDSIGQIIDRVTVPELENARFGALDLIGVGAVFVTGSHLDAIVEISQAGSRPAFGTVLSFDQSWLRGNGCAASLDTCPRARTRFSSSLGMVFQELPATSGKSSAGKLLVYGGLASHQVLPESHALRYVGDIKSYSAAILRGVDAQPYIFDGTVVERLTGVPGLHSMLDEHWWVYSPPAAHRTFIMNGGQFILDMVDRSRIRLLDTASLTPQIHPPSIKGGAVVVFDKFGWWREENGVFKRLLKAKSGYWIALSYDDKYGNSYFEVRGSDGASQGQFTLELRASAGGCDSARSVPLERSE